MKDDNYIQMSMLGFSPKAAAEKKVQEAEPGMRLKDFISDNPNRPTIQPQTIGMSSMPFEKKGRKTPDQLMKDGARFSNNDD